MVGAAASNGTETRFSCMPVSPRLPEPGRLVGMEAEVVGDADLPASDAFAARTRLAAREQMRWGRTSRRLAFWSREHRPLHPLPGELRPIQQYMPALARDHTWCSRPRTSAALLEGREFPHERPRGAMARRVAINGFGRIGRKLLPRLPEAGAGLRGGGVERPGLGGRPRPHAQVRLDLRRARRRRRPHR